MLLLYIFVKLQPPAWQSCIHIIHFWPDISAVMWRMSWSVVVWPLTPAVSTKNITARSGEAVLLSSDLQEIDSGWDFRWTHPKLVVSSKTNYKCHHKRCELLGNGSLRFSQVLPSDSGNYSLEVFTKTGKNIQNIVFLLKVEGESRTEEYQPTHIPFFIFSHNIVFTYIQFCCCFKWCQHFRWGNI